MPDEPGRDRAFRERIRRRQDGCGAVHWMGEHPPGRSDAGLDAGSPPPPRESFPDTWNRAAFRGDSGGTAAREGPAGPSRNPRPLPRLRRRARGGIGHWRETGCGRWGSGQSDPPVLGSAAERSPRLPEPTAAGPGQPKQATASQRNKLETADIPASTPPGRQPLPLLQSVWQSRDSEPGSPTRDSY